MKDNHKMLVLSFIAVAILILAGVGATYAYFKQQVENTSNVNLTTETTSQTNVEFNAGESIALVNAEPGDSIENTFNIELTSSNKTADIVTYTISWIIETNNFVHEPLHASDPQLVYSLYYSSDNATWNLLKSEDCTTFTDTIVLASDQKLTAPINGSNKVYWKMVLEYKSYDYNQATNMSKQLIGSLKVSGLD